MELYSTFERTIAFLHEKITKGRVVFFQTGKIDPKERNATEREVDLENQLYQEQGSSIVLRKVRKLKIVKD